jgi:hypothetical protein
VAFVVAVETAITMTRQRPAAPAPARDIPVPELPAGLNGHADRAVEIFSEDLARGAVPGMRRIRREMHLGQPRAQELRTYLSGLAASNGHRGGDA